MEQFGKWWMACDVGFTNWNTSPRNGMKRRPPGLLTFRAEQLGQNGTMGCNIEMNRSTIDLGKHGNINGYIGKSWKIIC
jgi:hypothetical protein